MKHSELVVDLEGLSVRQLGDMLRALRRRARDVERVLEDKLQAETLCSYYQFRYSPRLDGYIGRRCATGVRP